MQNYCCIDCVRIIVEYFSDLSYERMKKVHFEPWFQAIRKGRYDILCVLLEYGIERCDEFLDKNMCDSYSVLINSFKSYYSEDTFEKIFDLFIAAGINTVFSTVYLVYLKQEMSIRKFKTVCKLLYKYGFIEDVSDFFLTDEEDEDEDEEMESFG